MTTSPTRYPTSIDQTKGGHNQEFQSLLNLQKKDGYARTVKPVEGKNKTKYNPSNLTLTGYGFNLPSDARIRKIKVEVKHYVVPDTSSQTTTNASISMGIPAPHVSLTGNDKLKALSYQKIKAPTITHDEVVSTTFNVDVPASYLNSSKFGVIFSYPPNTSKTGFYIYLKYVRVQLSYVTPAYGVSLSKVTGGYNQETVTLKATVSNTNLCKGSPVTTITVPRGLSFKSWNNSNGSIITSNARTIQWTPKIGKSTGNVSAEFEFDINVTYGTGYDSYEAECVIGLNNYNETSGTCIFNIIDNPGDTSTETEDTVIETGDASTDALNHQVFQMTKDTGFDLDITLAGDVSNCPSVNGTVMGACITFDNTSVTSPEDYTFFVGETEIDNSRQKDVYIPLSLFDTDNHVTVTITPSKVLGSVCEYDTELQAYTTGQYVMDESLAVTGSDYYYWFDVYVRPLLSELSTPNFTLFQPTSEELDRLGDSIPYIVESHMKLITNESYTRDWYCNHRLGVFNNRCESNIVPLLDYKSMQVIDDVSYYMFLPSDTMITPVDADMPILHLESIEAYSDYEINLYSVSLEEPITLDNNLVELSVSDYLQLLFAQVEEDVVTINLHYTFTTGDYWVVIIIDFSNETVTFNLNEYDPTNYSNLSITKILNDAKWWSETIAGCNEYNDVTCEFPYNPDYPVYIIVCEDYPESEIYTNKLYFQEPCIIESTEYTGRLPNGTFPEPIMSLIDGGRASLTLPAYMNGNTVTIYDLPLDNEYGTGYNNIAVRGIALTGSIEQTDYQVLYATLESPTGATGKRSVILNDMDKTEDDFTFTIGGNGDLWGFSTIDMVNLADWSIILEVANTLTGTDATITFGHLQVILYIEYIEDQDIIITVEDENLAYYNAFITGLEVPEGLETDTDYLTIDGTDTNDAYRQNIREKQITIEFEIGDGCSLEASTESLRQITRLLTNERDEYNRPIPKRLEINHYPDVYWEYVMEEALDTELEINTYQCKAKLTIPAGTSYDKESTTTSTMGYVQGLAAINPVILIKPTSLSIEVLENISNQKFNLTLPESSTYDWNSGLIEIDTENRICWWKTSEDDNDSVNISEYADYNVDWFRLHGEYDFQGTGCIIRTIDYSERW